MPVETKQEKEITDLNLFDFGKDAPTTFAAGLPQLPVPEPGQEDWSVITHSTFEYEQQMLRMVTEGDTEGLPKLFANVPAGQPGNC